eukprot:5511169-Amphidinium_carterae.1
MLGPLQCKRHPNGRLTISWYPSIPCWEGGDHDTMIVIGSHADKQITNTSAFLVAASVARSSLSFIAVLSILAILVTITVVSGR